MRNRFLSCGRLLCAIGLLTGLGVAPTVGAQEEVTAPTPAPIRIRINIPARQLTLYEQGQVAAQYPVAIGALAYKSILMSDEITRLEWNPWWYPPPSPWAAGASVTPPGPRNPLGPVKMPLGQGIRIHGTNKEASVGTAASHGCFRMKNKDAEALAWYLQSRLTGQHDPALLEKYRRHRGTTFVVQLDQPVPVDVVYETAEVRDGALHLHPDVYRKVRNWFTPVADALQANGVDPAQVSPQRQQELRQRLRRGTVVIPVNELVEPPMNSAVPSDTPRSPDATLSRLGPVPQG